MKRNITFILVSGCGQKTKTIYRQLETVLFGNLRKSALMEEFGLDKG